GSPAPVPVYTLQGLVGRHAGVAGRGARGPRALVGGRRGRGPPHRPPAAARAGGGGGGGGGGGAGPGQAPPVGAVRPRLGAPAGDRIYGAVPVVGPEQPVRAGGCPPGAALRARGGRGGRGARCRGAATGAREWSARRSR